MRASPLVTLSLSDIHLFHKRVPVPVIIRALDKALYDQEGGVIPNIIHIAGDLFDSSTPMGRDDVLLVQDWWVRFIRYAAKHNILVRLLEGTPSHDARQPRTLANMVKELGVEVNFKYHDTLTIEYIPEYDINVLFIPDEWRHKPEDVWDDVQAELKAKGLKHVQYAVMHGAFRYQLPPIVAASCHNEDLYKALVTEYIFIGHIHTQSKNDHILAHGSLVPLEAGTGDFHGYVKVHAYGAKDRSDDVVEMKSLEPEVPFKDYDITDMEESVFQEMMRQLGYLKGLSYHRFFVGENDTERTIALTQLFRSLDGPKVDFVKPKKAALTEKELDEWMSFKPTPLTERDLSGLLMERLALNDPEKEQRALRLYEQAKERK